MKLLGKNRDGGPDAIESLLRAYISRPGNRECSEFDADLANAYIERTLLPASRSRYEQHLSECTPCRKNVIGLSRMLEPESRPVISAQVDRTARRQIFGITSWARWATAAAAVIVLAISLPLFLTRKSDRLAQESSQAAADSATLDSTQAENKPSEQNRVVSSKPSPAVSPASEPAKPSEKRPVDAISANGAAPTGQPGDVAGGAASSGKLEARAESKAGEQATVTSGAPPATEVAAGQAQQDKRSDQDSASSARQQQPSKDAAADTKVSDKEQDQQNAREKSRLAENAPAGPPPAAPGAKAGKMKRSSAMRALRDSAPAETVRPTEKRLGSKRFSLKDDTWTDKDFDPDKDLPIVTVIRDSNVYNELLAKQAGLKPYLGGFPPAERAIIVYKGTVYKLIPQP